MFDVVVEQRRVKQFLEVSIQNRTMHHALLFTGKKGIGKRMMALEYAKALFSESKDQSEVNNLHICERIDHGNHPDVEMICVKDGEASIKIDQIREMIARLSIRPFEENWRVNIIVDADMMTIEAQNALLKSLEEPEIHNLFVLTAESTDKIVDTVRSRCQILNFEPISDKGIYNILKAQGYTDEKAMAHAVRDCEGAPGKALTLLDDIALEELKNEALEVVGAILRGDGTALFPFCEKIGKDKKNSVEVLNFLILWFSNAAIESNFSDRQLYQRAEILDEKQCMAITDVFFELLANTRYNINLRLAWEAALLKLL